MCDLCVAKKLETILAFVRLFKGDLQLCLKFSARTSFSRGAIVRPCGMCRVSQVPGGLLYFIDAGAVFGRNEIQRVRRRVFAVSDCVAASLSPWCPLPTSHLLRTSTFNLRTRLVTFRRNYSQRTHAKVAVRQQSCCGDALSDLRLQGMRIRRIDEGDGIRALLQEASSPAPGFRRVAAFGIR